MALLRVDEGPPEDARLPELPAKHQRLHASSRGGRVLRALHADCRGLADLLKEAEEAAWAGLGSREDFIRECLGRPVDVIDMALDGVRLFDLSEPVPLDKAVEASLARRASERTQAAAANPSTGKVLPRDGSIHPGNARQFVGHTQPERAEAGGIGVVTQRKLDALARHAPELLEAVKEGRMSAHAAALEAGVVKAPCPVRAARRAVEKMTVEQLTEFKGWLGEKYRD